MSIINRVVEYLKKHAEFEANNADDEVGPFHLFLRALCRRLPPARASAWRQAVARCVCGSQAPCARMPASRDRGICVSRVSSSTDGVALGPRKRPAGRGEGPGGR